jgi:hypothetical protein
MTAVCGIKLGALLSVPFCLMDELLISNLLYMFQMGILREFPYICLIAEFLRTCVF